MLLLEEKIQKMEQKNKVDWMAFKALFLDKAKPNWLGNQAP